MSTHRESTVQPVFLPPESPNAPESGVLVLSDGSRATLWRSLPEDSGRVAKLLRRLPEPERREVLSSLDVEDEALEDFLSALGRTDAAEGFFVRRDDSRETLAFGGLRVRSEEGEASIALAVEPSARGKGLASLLLERLARLGAQRGVRRLIGVAHQENAAIIELFRGSGFELEEESRGDYLRMELRTREASLAEGEDGLPRRVFTAASLRPLFHPRSVAVVGASRDPGAVGHRILRSLLRGELHGPVYPVNPKADSVHAVKAYPSVDAIGEPVDLAVVAVPADAVPEVVEECARLDVGGLVVVSAGFAETGEAGRERQNQLARQVREHGMRMVGPNCLGLIHTDPGVSLNASFAPEMPLRGSVALCSQSGALGIAVIALARRIELGLSAFVSVGNKADVSANDLLEYWEEDPATSAILLYLESFGNPARFARIARRVARRKPVIAVKAGRTEAGSRAASSHTAALGSTDTTVQGLFRQTGIVRADSLEEMFGIARVLTEQPLLRGRRVAIVTNSGGPAILCADALEGHGIEVVRLEEATRRSLSEFLPPAASTVNPVDMIASAGPDAYRRAVEIVLAAAEVDALVAIYTPIGVFPVEQICSAVMAGTERAREHGGEGKPVLASIVGEDVQRGSLSCASEREKIPLLSFPEQAGRILGLLADYSEWKSSDPGMFPDFDDQNLGRAREVCREALSKRGEGWLSVQEARDVLEGAGLTVAEGGVASSADAAAKVAEKVGYPVAVKLASLSISHKTEMGGVVLELEDAGAVREAYERIEKRVREEQGDLEGMEGVLVQPMLGEATEVMIGVDSDPVFGPVVAFGLGGIHVEILRDIVFRVTPLTDRDAREMVHGIRGYRLLEGYRGHPAADVEALQEAVLRISVLVETVPEIVELDLNPIFALEPGKGYRIADARVKVRDPVAGAGR